MAQPLATPELPPSAQPSSGAGTLVAWAVAGFGAIFVLAALVLWFHYGTAVFFEMVAAGFSACF
jgi:hypothetical protein